MRPRREREGAALLIVLFILMMTTGTAVFALQSTQFEQRAAGALHQAVRTKYVAEGATMSVLALCYQTGTAGCTDVKRAGNNLDPALRSEYGLPDYGNQEIVYSLSSADMPVDEASTSFRTSPLVDDATLGGEGARATAYRADFLSVVEKWQVPNPGQSRERFRLIVSTFGEVGVAGDVRVAGSEERFAHQSVSSTRAFFDVR